MKQSFIANLFDNQPTWLTIIIIMLSSLGTSFWYVADMNKEIALLQSSYADIASDHQEITQSITKLNDKIDHQDDKIDQLYATLLHEKDYQRKVNE